MKILICASEYYPYGSGIANVAYNVVEQLKKKGVECIVCSPTGPDIKLGSSKLIKKYGIFGLIHYWMQVSEFFRNYKIDFDAVWCHNPIFLKKNPFNHCVITMHSTYYGETLNKMHPFSLKLYKTFASIIEKYSLNRLENNIIFTGVSQSVCNELKQIGIKNKNIKHIINGVNPYLFKPLNQNNDLRIKFGIPKEDIVILSVGRLTAVKQPVKLIDIFSFIEEKTMNITLVVAGDGELLNKTKKYAEEKNLKNIIFMGHVDYKWEVPNLYACSDFYIMASKYEGLPLTLLEAMASGLPCIVSNIPNLNVVNEANCGIVVDFSDIESATKQISEYIQKDNSEHSINARRYAENNLDWEIIAEEYYTEFEKNII
jgi:glycosyltransferase involved in cell wall biosynthesis